MAVDLFSADAAFKLLHRHSILFFGDSNVRAIYKDLLWLLETNCLLEDHMLKKKNERSFANDKNITNGVLMNSRNYQEVREYNRNLFIRFQFLTRLYQEDFVKYITCCNDYPNIIILNSCLWDISRWGPTGVSDFKKNLDKTFDLLRKTFGPQVRIIWLCSLPPSFEGKTSLLTKEIQFLRTLLPFHIVEANHYAALTARKYEVDVLDLHYHMRFMTFDRCRDGIHWKPLSVRYITNLLLTHLSLGMGVVLPSIEPIDIDFLRSTQVIIEKKATTKNNSLKQKAKQFADKITTVFKRSRKNKKNKLKRLINDVNIL